MISNPNLCLLVRPPASLAVHIFSILQNFISFKHIARVAAVVRKKAILHNKNVSNKRQLTYLLYSPVSRELVSHCVHTPGGTVCPSCPCWPGWSAARSCCRPGSALAPRRCPCTRCRFSVTKVDRKEKSLLLSCA